MNEISSFIGNRKEDNRSSLKIIINNNWESELAGEYGIMENKWLK